MNYFPEKGSRTLLWVLVAIFGILIVAGGLGYFYYQSYINKKQSAEVTDTVLAVVDNQNITQKDLDNFAAETSYGTTNYSISKDQKVLLLKTLVENDIYLSAAKRLNITVSQAEIDAQIKTESPNYVNLSQDLQKKTRENAQIEILKSKVEKAVISDVDGEFVLVRYDKYHPDMLNGTDAQTAALKAQVQPIAQDLYNQITAGKMNFAQALASVKSNATIGLSTYPGSLPEQGGVLSQVSSALGQSPEFIKNVSTMKIGDTKLFSVGVQTNDKQGNIVFKDGAFVIFKFESGKAGEASSIEQWIKDQYNNLNVKVYNEKIS